jgi:hypothetical protein
MVSPGADTQSGVKRALISAMVIPAELNADVGNLGPVSATFGTCWTRIVARRKYQSKTARQIECELPGTVAFERMRISSHQIEHPIRSLEIAQASPQLACAYTPQFSLGDGFFQAQIADFLVLERDLQDLFILSKFTDLVKILGALRLLFP